MHSEQYVSFRQASRELPGNPHQATIYRWAQRGIKGVRLESWLIGGRRFTSQQAIARFIALTTASGQLQAGNVVGDRATAIRNAERELAAAGV